MKKPSLSKLLVPRLLMALMGWTVNSAPAQSQQTLELYDPASCKLLVLGGPAVKDIAMGKAISGPCQEGHFEGSVTVGLLLTRHAQGEEERTFTSVRVGFVSRGSFVGYRLMIYDQGTRLSIIRPDGSPQSVPTDVRQADFLSVAYAAIDKPTLEELPSSMRDYLKGIVEIWHSKPTVFWNSLTTTFLRPIPNKSWKAPIPDDPKARGRGATGI